MEGGVFVCPGCHQEVDTGFECPACGLCDRTDGCCTCSYEQYAAAVDARNAWMRGECGGAEEPPPRRILPLPRDVREAMKAIAEEEASQR